MDPRVQTDPITGRPLGVLRRQREAEESDAEENRLVRSAAIMEELDGVHGQHLFKLLDGKLMAYIETILNDDPVAKCYLDLLTAIGSQRNVAQVALNRLKERRGLSLNTQSHGD